MKFYSYDVETSSGDKVFEVILRIIGLFVMNFFIFTPIFLIFLTVDRDLGAGLLSFFLVCVLIVLAISLFALFKITKREGRGVNYKSRVTRSNEEERKKRRPML